MSVLHVEQLDASGLQHSGQIAWAVIGGENKRLQRRHFTGVERTPKLRRLPVPVSRGSIFPLSMPLRNCLLERSQNSGRAVLRPADAADSCSARRLRRRRRTQGPVRLSSDQHVREANAFGSLIVQLRTLRCLASSARRFHPVASTSEVLLASPLRQGERTEVRGSSHRRRYTQQPSPSPSPSKGEVTQTRSGAARQR